MSDKLEKTREPAPGSAGDTTPISAGVAPSGITRRRFTRAALGVAPVALALVHRPAFAQMSCKSPSGFESANLSNHHGDDLCQGGTPGYWRGTSNKPWPSPYLRYGSVAGMPPQKKDWQKVSTWTWEKSGGTRIREAFPGCGMPPGDAGYALDGLYGDGELTMMQVLLLGGNPGGDPYQLGGHLVAALLNAANGWTPGVLSELDVIKIWVDHFCGPGFQPVGASEPWDSEKIVEYLQSTMTQTE